MTLKTYKCPNCGADIEVNADFDDATCNYCRTTFKLEEESTAKYAINKISGTINKVIDNYEVHREDRERIRRERQKEATKSLILMVIVFVIILLIIQVAL